MNTADIVVIVILCVIVTAAVLVMVRNRRKGKNSCGGDCSHCGGCNNMRGRK